MKNIYNYTDEEIRGIYQLFSSCRKLKLNIEVIQVDKISNNFLPLSFNYSDRIDLNYIVYSKAGSYSTIIIAPFTKKKAAEIKLEWCYKWI